MEHYWKNLWLALLGRHVEQPEPPEMSALRESIKEKDKQLLSMQALVENLRQRVNDWTTQIAQIKEDYRTVRKTYESRIMELSQMVANRKKTKNEEPKRPKRKQKSKTIQSHETESIAVV